MAVSYALPRYRKQFIDDPYLIEGEEEPEAPAESIPTRAPMPPPSPAASTVADDEPTAPPISPRMPPPQPPETPMQRYQKLAAAPPPPPKSGTLKNIGEALLSHRMGPEAASKLMHPRYATQRGAYEQQLHDAAVAAKAQHENEAFDLTKEEKAAAIAGRQATTRRTDREEQEFQQKQREAKESKDYINNTNRFKAFVAGRPVEVRGADEPAPANSTVVPFEHPDAPGSVAYVPNAFRKATKDLIESGALPGYKEGEEVPRDEYMEALKSHRAMMLEENKVKTTRDPFNEFAMAIRAEGGDPLKPETMTPELVQRSLKRVEGLRMASRPPHQGPQSLVMIPDGKGGYTAKAVGEGSSVPRGAITPSGMSQLEVPTAATRAMAEKAPRVIQFTDRINQILDENEKQLGPLKSRWSEFTAGRVGLRNKGFTQLRTVAGLLDTALMNMHVGARGGEKIMEHFKDLLNVAVQDPDNLRDALAEIKMYAQSVEKEGKAKGATEEPPPATPEYVQIRKDKKGNSWGWRKGGKEWEQIKP